MEAYHPGVVYRPEFKSSEVVLQKGAFPRDTKLAIGNMADVDDEKMNIILPVSQFTMTNHRFMMQADDGSGVFFYWYNQLSNGFAKGAVQFILNDTATNTMLDYQEDPGATERDKELLTRIKRRGGSHELVGGFKVEVLHANIKECYDKLVRHFERIEEPINLPQSEGPGGLDDAVYEGSDGNQSDSEGERYDDDPGMFIDPKLLGDKEKLKPVPAAGNNFMGFDFDSAVGGKGFADLFGGQSKPQHPGKNLGGRKNSFEDLLNIMDGEGRDHSKEPVPAYKVQTKGQTQQITKQAPAKISNPFADDEVIQPSGQITSQYQTTPQAANMGLSSLGISKIEAKITSQPQSNPHAGYSQGTYQQAYQTTNYAQQNRGPQLSYQISGVHTSGTAGPIQAKPSASTTGQYSYQQQTKPITITHQPTTTTQPLASYQQPQVILPRTQTTQGISNQPAYQQFTQPSYQPRTQPPSHPQPTYPQTPTHQPHYHHGTTTPTNTQQPPAPKYYGSRAVSGQSSTQHSQYQQHPTQPYGQQPQQQHPTGRTPQQTPSTNPFVDAPTVFPRRL